MCRGTTRVYTIWNLSCLYHSVWYFDLLFNEIKIKCVTCFSSSVFADLLVFLRRRSDEWMCQNMSNLIVFIFLPFGLLCIRNFRINHHFVLLFPYMYVEMTDIIWNIYLFLFECLGFYLVQFFHCPCLEFSKKYLSRL